MNDEQMIKVMEENVKIMAKLLVVLRHRELIKDTDIEFIFNDDLGDDDTLEID